MKPLKILYFINDSMPTAKQIADAEQYGNLICYRNAVHVPQEGALEACDGVAGEVPARYAAEFKTAAEAVEKRTQALAELAAKVGDSPAPVSPQGDGTAKASPDVQQAATAGAGAADGAGDAAADLAQVAPGAAPAAVTAWQANK
jgi:hypothetical protein